MTPEWRCRTVACGYEWDTTTPHPTEEIIERLRREVDSQQRQLNISWKKESELATLLRLEKEGRRNDESELEGLRKKFDMKERELDAIVLDHTRKENNHRRGVGAACSVFFIGLIGASIVGWSGPGVFLGILALSCVAYVLVSNL
jgi:hypothetical protein